MLIGVKTQDRLISVSPLRKVARIPERLPGAGPGGKPDILVGRSG